MSVFFEQQSKRYSEAIEAYLSGQFKKTEPWGELYASMRYSLLAGGKRIRPMLTLEFCRLHGTAWGNSIAFWMRCRNGAYLFCRGPRRSSMYG